MQSSKPIMLVEDDNIDAMTVRRAMKDLHVANELVRASDGEQALDYLRNSGNRRPRLILLDLNMPKMNGLEFLRIVKDDENLKTIPVIVLTASGEQRDIAESFSLSVAGYMVKPVDYTEFKETMRVIDEYWTLSEMPEQLDRVRESKSETGIPG